MQTISSFQTSKTPIQILPKTAFCHQHSKMHHNYDKLKFKIRNKYKTRRDGGLQFQSGQKTLKIDREVSKTNKNDDEVYLKRPYSYNIVFNNGSFYRVDLYFDFVDSNGL